MVAVDVPVLVPVVVTVLSAVLVGVDVSVVVGVVVMHSSKPFGQTKAPSLSAVTALNAHTPGMFTLVQSPEVP